MSEQPSSIRPSLAAHLEKALGTSLDDVAIVERGVSTPERGISATTERLVVGALTLEEQMARAAKERIAQGQINDAQTDRKPDPLVTASMITEALTTLVSSAHEMERMALEVSVLMTGAQPLNRITLPGKPETKALLVNYAHQISLISASVRVTINELARLKGTLK